MFLKEIFGETVVCDKSSNLLVWECPVEVVLRNMGPLARHGVIAVITGEVEAVVVTVAAPETHDKLNFTVTLHVSSTKCIYLNFQKPCDIECKYLVFVTSQLKHLTMPGFPDSKSVTV